MKPLTVQLDEQIAKNKSRIAVSRELSRRLLAAYLAGGTSYRKLAREHELPVKTVARAIRRAAEEQSHGRG